MAYLQRTQKPGDVADEPKPSDQKPEPTVEETKSGDLKPFGQTQSYKENSENRKARLIEEFGSEELYNAVGRRLNEIFEEEGYEPVIYINGAILDKIAAAPPEEQRIKNQFETGTSEGALDQINRRAVEDFTLGFDSGFDLDPNGVVRDEVILDTDDGSLITGPHDPLSGRERAIYAGFQPPNDSHFKDYNQYGKIAFRIKDLTPDDYTVTGNDSLNSFSKSRAFSTPDKISAKTRGNFDMTSMNTDIVDQPGELKQFVDFHGGDPDAIARGLIKDVWDSDFTYFESQIMKEITPDMLEPVLNRSLYALSDEAKALFNIEDSDFVKESGGLDPDQEDDGLGIGIPDADDEFLDEDPFAVDEEELSPEETLAKLKDMAEKYGIDLSHLDISAEDDS